MLFIDRPRSLQRLAWHGAIALIAAIVVLPETRSDEPRIYALTNARIFPVTSAPLEKGTVVIRDGIIEAVGANISLPGDARVIDSSGLTIYPGFIDSLSHVALEEARPESPSAGTPALRLTPAPEAAPQAPAATPEERQGLTPFLNTADVVNPTNRKIEAARSSGITTALLAPRRGFFQGQSTLINLSGASPGSMVVKTPVAMHVGLQSRSGFGSGYPASLMGVLAFVKQSLLDAQHYDLAWRTYKAHRGTSRPEYSRALEALQPVVKQELSIVLPGDTPAQIQRALDLATDFKLKMILSGGSEAGPLASVLKENKVSVLLSIKFPERDSDTDPEAEEELASLRRRVEAPATAAALAKSGVQFAFQSGDMENLRDFIRNVRRAVEFGLDKETALRALTLAPAEIFGVGDRLGSLEKGKIGNIVLATGDIFDSRTRVKHVFVDGVKFDIQEPESPRSMDATATSTTTLTGTWILKVNAPEGPIQATLNLTQSGSTLSGSLTSPRGTQELFDGSVSGNSISFKAAMPSAGERTRIVTFTGVIRGDNIVGSIDAGSTGKLDFTGTRNPNQL